MASLSRIETGKWGGKLIEFQWNTAEYDKFSRYTIWQRIRWFCNRRRKGKCTLHKYYNHPRERICNYKNCKVVGTIFSGMLPLELSDPELAKETKEWVFDRQFDKVRQDCLRK